MLEELSKHMTQDFGKGFTVANLKNMPEFYMQEAVKSRWSTRQLGCQINSFFYERLLSSKNKKQVAEEIQTLEPAKKSYNNVIV